MDARQVPQTEGGTPEQVRALRERAGLDREQFGALIGSSARQAQAWEFFGLRSQHAWDLLQIRALWSAQDYLGAAKAILGTTWIKDQLGKKSYMHSGWRLGPTRNGSSKNKE